MSLKYIVTGNGHSGTGYMANLLCSCGIKCGHETVFRPDGVHLADVEADSSFAAAFWLDHPICNGAKVVHVVRNPLDFVKSLIRSGWSDAAEAMMRAAFDDLPEDAIGFNAQKWIRWNELIEKRADIRVRIEDRTKIAEQLGLEQKAPWDDPKYNAHPAGQLKEKSPSVQRRCMQAPVVTWNRMPEELKKMAVRYGYEVGK